MGQLRDQLSEPVRARARWPLHLARALRGSLVLRLMVLAVVVATTSAAVALHDGAGAASGSVSRLRGGASSMEALVADLLAALEGGDRDALAALRVTREEYLDIVLPGHVKPGEPAQALNPEAAGYFWGVLDTKSFYFEKALLERFTGRHLEVVEVGFEKGVADYAGHRAHKRIALKLRDADGRTVDLRAGSVIERDGRFKFESFIRD